MNIDRIANKIAVGLPYDSLNDAATETGNDGYSIGGTDIWYMKPDFFRDAIMGFDWLEQEGKVPDPDDLRETHVFIGRIKEHDLNNVYKMMQGEKWSPKGVARQILRRKGVEHTSMSIGDIIRIGSKTMMVDRSGFKEIPKKSKVAKNMTAEDRSQEAYSYMKYWAGKEVANLEKVVKGLQEEIERANKQIAGLDKMGSGVIEAPTFVKILDGRVEALLRLVADMKSRTDKFSAKD
jgi:hypothetical protein